MNVTKHSFSRKEYFVIYTYIHIYRQGYIALSPCSEHLRLFLCVTIEANITSFGTNI